MVTATLVVLKKIVATALLASVIAFLRLNNFSSQPETNHVLNSTPMYKYSIRSDKGLTLELNVSFRISLRWPIYFINPVDKTKLSV